MKSVLLIGLGRFGKHIAMKLDELNCEVMAVDIDEERVNAVLPYVTEAQIGDSTSEEFLETLGIRNYDACIVTIGDDFQNSLETASLLKEMGARKVISRAATGVQEKFLLRNGADRVVYPEKQMAAQVAIRCTSEYIQDYIELDQDYSIFELSIPREWMGKTIRELEVRNRYGINILGIRKNGKVHMNITPDSYLDDGEAILVLGRDKAVQKWLRI
ncbi:MAG: TrkA family potassium uptake protein [Clostridiales bacterium]|nr:TrkA family potassium uptake protein [Clostridiales bacterium]